MKTGNFTEQDVLNLARKAYNEGKRRCVGTAAQQGDADGAAFGRPLIAKTLG